MYIKSISLENYRNYKEAKIDFNEKVNIFVGKNAQGKTNLLESIYLCASGRSFRTSREKELIKFNEDICRVRAEFENGGVGTTEITIGKEGRRKARINGIDISKAVDFMDNIYVVIFSPEDLKIVKDEPEKRRNFIDNELCQIKISYLADLYNYKKVLQQRNAYLKENDIDESYLNIWTENLIKYGSGIMSDRRRFIKKLGIISGSIHEGITDGKEELTVNYDPDIEDSEDADEQERLMKKAFEESAEDDIRNRTTTRGPHRDDIELLIDGINIRRFGSQGQQRTAALSLKMAEIELIKEDKKTTPVLLLDDVLSELDPIRQKYLISSLKDIQIFITTTEVSDEIKSAFKEGKIAEINNGKIL